MFILHKHIKWSLSYFGLSHVYIKSLRKKNNKKEGRVTQTSVYPLSSYQMDGNEESEEEMHDTVLCSVSTVYTQ